MWAACWMLTKRLISPLAVRISTVFGLVVLLLISFGAKVFSSSVGVSSVVYVFMLFLQDYACGGVFVPLLLQHDGVALLLALVAQALDGMGGGWLKVQVARDVAQRVAVVGFDNGLRFGLCFWFGCLGGAECA